MTFHRPPVGCSIVSGQTLRRQLALRLGASGSRCDVSQILTQAEQKREFAVTIAAFHRAGDACRTTGNQPIVCVNLFRNFERLRKTKDLAPGWDISASL